MDRPSSYIVLDTETTGFGLEARVIDIAAVKVENDEIVATFSELINPGVIVPYHISRLTGIYSPMLKDARKPAEVLNDFLRFIGDLPLVGHNIDFDLRMIGQELKRIGRELPCAPVYDTLDCARQSCPGWPRYKLADLCRCLNVINTRAHRALADVLATAECFAKLTDAQERTYCYIPEHRVAYVPVGYPNLQGFSFCITGDPITMSKDEAYALILERDGTVRQSVSGKLDYLVNCFADDYVSTKLSEARAQIEKGKRLQIISEEELLSMLGFFREDDEEGIAAAIANPPEQADGYSFPCTPTDIEDMYKDKIFDKSYDGYQGGGFTHKDGTAGHLIYAFYGEKAFEFKPGPRGKSTLYLPAGIMEQLFPDEDFKKGKYHAVDCLTDNQMDLLCELLRERKAEAFRNLGAHFDCCNDHVRCSDERGCVHKSDPFYNDCTYRRNLEQGRIFYGKNRNV